MIRSFEGLCYRGDCTEPARDIFDLNPNQSLNYDAQDRVLTYEGERSPLHQDGILNDLAYVADAWKPYKRENGLIVTDRDGNITLDPDLPKIAEQLNICEYESSQPDWEWWMTERSYISILTPNELWRYCVDNKVIPALYNDSYRRIYASNFDSLAEFMTAVKELVYSLGGTEIAPITYETGYEPNNPFTILSTQE